MWTLGLAFFASFAIWCGFMAEPRYRSSRGRGSIVSKAGIVIGIFAFAVTAYAFAAIALASSGTRLPAPSHWLSDTQNGSTTQPAPPGAVPVDGAAESTGPVETERLALAQAVGTAVFVLEQTASADGPWPATLAITTDASALITPDGLSLAPLPPGTQVMYSTSSDLREFSLTLVGSLGAVATYESTTGTLSTSAP